MKRASHQPVELRRISPVQVDLIRRHLEELDDDSLSARFGMSVTRRFIDDYARRLSDEGSITIGAFQRDRLIGVAELHALRPVGCGRTVDMELAMTVEASCQGEGVGTTLALRAVQAAASMKADQLHACFIPRNHRMRRIASRLDMTFSADGSFVIASLAVAVATRAPCVVAG
jgi:predicted GNAT superfamily acetyltransferase